MNRFLTLMLLALLFTSCKFNVTDTNDQFDMMAAQKITDRFYAATFTKNITGIDTLFSEELYKETPKDSVLKMFTNKNSEFGDLITWNLKEWKTQDVMGTDSRIEYLFIYDAEYTNIKTIETFYMRNENNKIRILKYDVNLPYGDKEIK